MVPLKLGKSNKRRSVTRYRLLRGFLGLLPNSVDSFFGGMMLENICLMQQSNKLFLLFVVFLQHYQNKTHCIRTIKTVYSS